MLSVCSSLHSHGHGVSTPTVVRRGSRDLHTSQNSQSSQSRNWLTLQNRCQDSSTSPVKIRSLCSRRPLLRYRSTPTGKCSPCKCNSLAVSGDAPRLGPKGWCVCVRCWDYHWALGVSVSHWDVLWVDESAGKHSVLWKSGCVYHWGSHCGWEGWGGWARRACFYTGLSLCPPVLGDYASHFFMIKEEVIWPIVYAGSQINSLNLFLHLFPCYQSP